MKTLHTHIALLLGSLTFAAMLAVQPGNADEVRASFERNFNRTPTLGSVTTVAVKTDWVQKAVNEVTWTRPEQEIQRSFERDLNRVPTHSGAPSYASAEPDPMQALFGELMSAASREDRKVLAECEVGKITVD